MSRLSELLRAANTENLGVRDLSRRAKGLGVTLSPSNISNYMNGKHPEQPPARTMAAWSKVLDVPLEDLEAAVVPTDGEPYDAPDESRLLTAPQRAAVNEIIRLLADGNRTSNATTPPLPTTQEQDAQGEEAGEKTGPSPAQLDAHRRARATKVHRGEWAADDPTSGSDD